MTPKKDDAKVVKQVQQEVKPKPAPTPAPATTEAAASKQTQTLDSLKAAWTKRGIDLTKLSATPDGKYLNVLVAEGWPIVRIGVGGGIDLPAIRSYPKAFDAAVQGDVLLAKQNAKAAKAAAPAPATKPASEPKKDEPKQTPASKKATEHQKLEAQIEQQQRA